MTKELLLETFLPQKGHYWLWRPEAGSSQPKAAPSNAGVILGVQSQFRLSSWILPSEKLQFSLLAVSPQSLQFVLMLNKQASVRGSSLSPLQCSLITDGTVCVLLPSNTFAVDSTNHKVYGSFLRNTSLKFYLFIWGGMCMQQCMCGALQAQTAGVISVLSWSCGPGDWTWVVRLGSRHLYLLRRLTSFSRNIFGMLLLCHSYE